MAISKSFVCAFYFSGSHGIFSCGIHLINECMFPWSRTGNLVQCKGKAREGLLEDNKGEMYTVELITRQILTPIWFLEKRYTEI